MNQFSLTAHITLYYISYAVFLLTVGGVILLCVLCCLAVVAFWISCVLSILYIIGSCVLNYSFIPRYLISPESLHVLNASVLYLLTFTFCLSPSRVPEKTISAGDMETEKDLNS